jgi:hypothetical protein
MEETAGFKLTEKDLKEIFALFTSSTKYERDQVYNKEGNHFFLKHNILEEYSLTEEKREYALDSWRAVIGFLRGKGFSLKKGEQEIDLGFIEDYL